MSEKQKQELLDRMSKIGSPEQRLIFSYMQHSTEQNTEIIHPSKITNAVLLIALHGNVEHKTQLPAAQATQQHHSSGGGLIEQPAKPAGRGGGRRRGIAL